MGCGLIVPSQAAQHQLCTCETKRALNTNYDRFELTSESYIDVPDAGGNWPLTLSVHNATLFSPETATRGRAASAVFVRRALVSRARRGSLFISLSRVPRRRRSRRALSHVPRARALSPLSLSHRSRRRSPPSWSSSRHGRRPRPRRDPFRTSASWRVSRRDARRRPLRRRRRAPRAEPRARAIRRDATPATARPSTARSTRRIAFRTSKSWRFMRRYARGRPLRRRRRAPRAEPWARAIRRGATPSTARLSTARSARPRGATASARSILVGCGHARARARVPSFIARARFSPI